MIEWDVLEEILKYAGIIYVTGLLIMGLKRLIESLTRNKSE